MADSLKQLYKLVNKQYENIRCKPERSCIGVLCLISAMDFQTWESAFSNTTYSFSDSSPSSASFTKLNAYSLSAFTALLWFPSLLQITVDLVLLLFVGESRPMRVPMVCSPLPTQIPVTSSNAHESAKTPACRCSHCSAIRVQATATTIAAVGTIGPVN